VNQSIHRAHFLLDLPVFSPLSDLSRRLPGLEPLVKDQSDEEVRVALLLRFFSNEACLTRCETGEAVPLREPLDDDAELGLFDEPLPES